MYQNNNDYNKQRQSYPQYNNNSSFNSPHPNQRHGANQDQKMSGMMGGGPGANSAMAQHYQQMAQALQQQQQQQQIHSGGHPGPGHGPGFNEDMHMNQQSPAAVLNARMNYVKQQQQQQQQQHHQQQQRQQNMAASGPPGHVSVPVPVPGPQGHGQPSHGGTELRQSNNTKPVELSTPKEILDVLGHKMGPPQTLEERELLEIIKKDAKHDEVYQTQERQYAERMLKKHFEIDYYRQLQIMQQTDPSIAYTDGYKGYGNGWTAQRSTALLYPRNRKRASKARELVISEEQAEYAASVPEELVPIRIDFDEDKYRLRDTFTFNKNEPIISIAHFAEVLLDDFGMPLHLANHITSSIKEQINDYQPHHVSSSSSSNTDKPGEKSSGSDSKMILSSTDTPPNKLLMQLDAPALSSSLPGNDDMRITIKLDITMGRHNLVDQFEWDINNPDNNPEEFATLMCEDLALTGEFATAIAHAIREQSELHIKSLVLSGHQFDGRAIEDEEIRREMRPPINPTECFRSKQALREFSPVLFEIPDGELDRQDKDRDRDFRRKRRQGRTGRRGGPTIPDLRENIRTFRTPVYHSILPGGIDRNLEVLKRQVQKLDDSDDDEETTSSRSRRAKVSSFTGIAGGISYMTPPIPPTNFTEKYGEATSESPNRYGTANSKPFELVLDEQMEDGTGAGEIHSVSQLNVQNELSRGYHSGPHAMPMSFNNRASFIVKLKVPKLREFLVSRGYHV